MAFSGADMTTDKDQSMDDQSPAVVSAVKGIDVTPNKDEGVRKVGFNLIPPSSVKDKLRLDIKERSSNYY